MLNEKVISFKISKYTFEKIETSNKTLVNKNITDIYNIDKNTPLTHDQDMAVKYGAHREARLGSIVEPGEAVRWVRVQKLNGERMQSLIDSQRVAPEVKNEIASDLARGSVEARTASINKTKSNFDEHTASLIRYYGKGSGNP